MHDVFLIVLVLYLIDKCDCRTAAPIRLGQHSTIRSSRGEQFSVFFFVIMFMAILLTLQSWGVFNPVIVLLAGIIIIFFFCAALHRVIDRNGAPAPSSPSGSRKPIAMQLIGLVFFVGIVGVAVCTVGAALGCLGL